MRLHLDADPDHGPSFENPRTTVGCVGAANLQKIHRFQISWPFLGSKWPRNTQTHRNWPSEARFSWKCSAAQRRPHMAAPRNSTWEFCINCFCSSSCRKWNASGKIWSSDVKQQKKTGHRKFQVINPEPSGSNGFNKDPIQREHQEPRKTTESSDWNRRRPRAAGVTATPPRPTRVCSTCVKEYWLHSEERQAGAPVQTSEPGWGGRRPQPESDSREPVQRSSICSPDFLLKTETDEIWNKVMNSKSTEVTLSQRRDKNKFMLE